MTDTVLGRECPIGLPGAMARRIREEADSAARALHDNPKRRKALHELAAFVEARDFEDQRLRGIGIASSAYGNSDDYNPGPVQTILLATLGDGPAPIPISDSILDELAAAATEDLFEHFTTTQRDLRGEADRIQAHSEEQEAIARRVQEADGQAEELRGELSAAREEIGALKKDVAWLKPLAESQVASARKPEPMRVRPKSGGNGRPGSKPKPKRNTRRNGKKAGASK